MRKYLLLLILGLCLVSCPTYSHHGNRNILDTLVLQSVQNYVMSIECIKLLNQSER